MDNTFKAMERKQQDCEILAPMIPIEKEDLKE
jgi:hypothetical protein